MYCRVLEEVAVLDHELVAVVVRCRMEHDFR